MSVLTLPGSRKREFSRLFREHYPAVLAYLRRRVPPSHAEELAAEYRITARESEIMLQLARGRSAAFIADELVCSPATVRTHMKNIYAKLGVHSKQELIDLFAD